MRVHVAEENEQTFCFICSLQDMSGKTFRSIFKYKQDKLVEKIDTEHGLLRKLEAYGVITDMHRSAIEVIFVNVDEF